MNLKATLGVKLGRNMPLITTMALVYCWLGQIDGFLYHSLKHEICFLSCYLHNKNNPIRVETGDSPNIGENPLCTNIPADSASNILRYFECNTAIKWYGMHVIFKTVYPNSDNHILIREFLIYGNEKDVSKKNDFL